MTAAMAGLLALSGQANALDLKVSGYWKAYYAEQNQICGMESHGTMSHGQAAMHIKFIVGQPGLLVQIFKTSWDLPNGVKVPIVIDVDGEPTYEVEATGYSGKETASLVEWRIRPDDAIPFIKRFAAARSMSMRFQNGNEAPWVVNLGGSGAISLVMFRCIAAFGKPATQPYGAPQASRPTQPYGAPSTPTQPYDITPAQKQPEQTPPVAQKKKPPVAPVVKKDDGSI
ncbi:hypothetical protein Q2941_18625 [Bradyrhizobium sp. UFLA05-153]